MKLAVGWADRGDAGLVIGLLVGGLTLVRPRRIWPTRLAGLDWRMTLATASVAAVAASGLIGLVRLGPRHAPAIGFNPAAALQLWRNPGTRLATLGYLGHMWELYAMWAWVGLYLAASFASRRGSEAVARDAALATFAVIAAARSAASRAGSWPTGRKGAGHGVGHGDLGDVLPCWRGQRSGFIRP